LLALTAPAFAEASSSDKAAAEALFDEGRRLAQAGKFAEGCPKLEASQKLDPALGTLLNLADCNEKLGKTASAWAQYREAISLARAAGSAEREKFAMDRSKALEPHLSTLTIRVADADAGAAPVEVKRDGMAVDSATLGSALPVDPGTHEVTAASPGMKTWSSKVDVGKDAAKVEVEIPKLEPEGATTAGAAGGTTEPPAKSGSSMRPVAIAVGAVGLVGIGVGAFFGLSASSTWSDAKDTCTSYPKGCSPSGVEDQKSASTKATVSTIAFIAGGAALAVGTVLWFTAGSGNKQTAIGVGPGMVAARGSF
jgi:hypothetical protein